jgi:uncharacterized membrane protein YvbJ
VAYCTYCGQQISDAATACTQCGHPIAPLSSPAMANRRTENLAVASLVLGLAGFVVCPLVCSIIAVVLGYQARRRLDEDPTLDGEGMAKAGIILGFVGIAFGLVIVVGFVVAMLAGFAVNAPSDGIDALRRIG